MLKDVSLFFYAGACLWVPDVNMELHYRRTFTVVLFLSIGRHVIGVYPFERDVARLTDTELPKRWLIFMENRARKCMPHSYTNDIVQYLQCLATNYRVKLRCHKWVTKRISSNNVEMFTSKSRIMFRVELGGKYANCVKERTMASKIYVHKLFPMNITFQSFYFTLRDRIPPFEDNCAGIPVPIVLTLNGTSYEYCGKRFPWSMHSGNNMASITIPNRNLGHYLTSYFVIFVSVDISVTDHYQVTVNSSPNLGDPTVWGDPRVHTYHVSVAMLHRIRVAVPSELPEGSGIIVYDGPNAQVPQVSYVSSPQFINMYLSSTFQIFVLYVYQKEASYKLQYNADDNTPAVLLKPDDNLIINNNISFTGAPVEAYMRIFHISTSLNAHPRVKIRALKVTGPFRGMFASAGVAIYNIKNGISLLIAHWCDTLSSKERNLTITGSQNTLVIAVYSYPQFTFLFVSAEIDLDICSSVFVRTSPLVHIKPDGFSTNDCLSIHIIRLPRQATGEIDFVLDFDNIQVWYVYAIQVYYSFFGMNRAVEVFGEVIMRRGLHVHVSIMGHGPYQTTQNDDNGVLDVIGRIQNITMHEWRAKSFAVVVAQRTSCVQPCEVMGRFLLSAEKLGTGCNLCTHMWFGQFSNRKTLHGNPNTTMEFKLVYGIRLLCYQIRSLVNVMHGGGLRISYCTNKSRVTIKFQEHRSIRLYVEKGELWKMQRTGVVDFRYPRKFRDVFDNAVFQWGMYEYILRIKIWRRTRRRSDWLQALWGCHQVGAYLLTIDDKRELKFIIDNIIKPTEIDLAFIGMWRMVSA